MKKTITIIITMITILSVCIAITSCGTDTDVAASDAPISDANSGIVQQDNSTQQKGNQLGGNQQSQMMPHQESTANTTEESIVKIEVDNNVVAPNYIATEEFTANDYEIDCIADSCSSIILSDDTSSSEDNSVVIVENTITITQEGTYLISGALSDGQLVINAEDTAKIQLILDNVTINNSTTAAIYIELADKVFITTKSDTVNSLSSNLIENESAETNIDAAIFSKEDLTLNGEGTLIVAAANGNGITSKDDLVITSGSYILTSDNHGLEANNSIRIADGSFDITCTKDALHCNHDEDNSLGYIYIADGSLLLSCESDGMDSSSSIEIENGLFDITALGKGISADTAISLIDGTYVINSCDDAIHATVSLDIFGGSYTIETDDDAIHADYMNRISDGEINILSCYEGIEGHFVDISGGSIQITGIDDAINAATSDYTINDDEVTIRISDGTILINTSNTGDGLDSNGAVYVTGGVTVISSTTEERDTALDYTTAGTITGGTFIATESSSATRLNFDSDSTQGSIMYDLDTACNDNIQLIASDGTVIVDFTPIKEYQTLLISDAQIIQGETYSLIVGNDTYSITMDELIYGTNTDPMSMQPQMMQRR